MRKIFKAIALTGAMATVSGCQMSLTESESRVAGGVGTGVVAGIAGASDAGIAAAVVLGSVAGGVLNRAVNAGCRLSSSPKFSGGLVFQSNVSGVFLNCASVGLNDQTAKELLKPNNEWNLITTIGQSSHSHSSNRSAARYVGDRGGFRNNF